MNKVTSTIAVLVIGLAALIAYVVITNQTVVGEDVQIQVADMVTEQIPEENIEESVVIEAETMVVSEELAVN